MATFFLAIVVLCIIVNVLIGIWFLVVAFREGGFLWGLAVFFIPFAGLFFLVKYWYAAKTPFLAGLANAAVLVVTLVIAVVVSPDSLQKFQETESAAEERGYEEGADDRDYGDSRSRAERRNASTVTAEPVAEATSVAAALGEEAPLPPPPLDKAPPPPPPPPPVEEIFVAPQDPRTSITLREAADHIGQTVEVIDQRGSSSKGTIVAVEGDKLVIESWMSGGGSMVFRLPAARIREIRLNPS